MPSQKIGIDLIKLYAGDGGCKSMGINEFLFPIFWLGLILFSGSVLMDIFKRTGESGSGEEGAKSA
jgi:hypothetical protein